MRVVCVCINAAAVAVALFPFIAEEMPGKCRTKRKPEAAVVWGGIARRGAARVITNINTHAGEQTRKTQFLLLLLSAAACSRKPRVGFMHSPRASMRLFVFCSSLLMRKRVWEGSRETEKRRLCHLKFCSSLQFYGRSRELCDPCDTWTKYWKVFSPKAQAFKIRLYA